MQSEPPAADVAMPSPSPSGPAAMDPELARSPHIDDDAGAVDQGRAPAAAGGVSNREEAEAEAGEVTEGSAKASPVHGEDAKGEGEGKGGGDKEDDAEGEKKKRPGRPKKKSMDEEVEEEPKAPKRARLKVEKKEAAAFVADRPTRERKSIDRFIASAEKDKTKELQIKQGGGTPLKDIPNVVYKLSKRYKHDDALSQLHSVLFNKRGKAAVLKQNILQFSGYVWVENEAKERAKVQEKLERYTKESLAQFVDVLDIHCSKTLKKEELVANVLDFLEKPHRTTDTLLELKEQERKSSGKRSSSAKSPGRPKIPKVEGKTSKKRERKKATDNGGSDESEKLSESESLEEEEIDQKLLNFKDDSDHEVESMEEEKKPSKSSSTTIKQDTEENVAEEEDREDKEESPPPRKKLKVDATPKTPSKSVDRVYSKKQLKEGVTNTPPKSGPGRPKKSLETSGKKDASTSKHKEPRKNSSVKGNKAKKKEVPSDAELQGTIRELLKEADFSKVTFTDLVSQLEGVFGVSLIEHKAHVKGLIRDEISKVTDADEESEGKEPAVESANDDNL